MKKSGKCVAQTINLSKPKTCNRPRQIQRLMNADVANPCPELSKNVYQNSCRPVPVRICTLIDMQRTLPPKVCECPQKPNPETIGKKVYRWVKNIVKSGIAGGFVYWTTAEGFWGDGQEAEGLYRRIMATVSPAFEEVVESEEIKLPHIENVRHDFLDSYNRLILYLVGIAVGVPIMIEKKIYDVLFPCYDIEDNKSGVEKKKQSKRKGG